MFRFLNYAWIFNKNDVDGKMPGKVWQHRPFSFGEGNEG